MTFEELLDMPSSSGRDGIHICAQLRIDAMQLSRHGINWAAKTMETAAQHIEKLEKMLLEQK